jgi:hypothetical protein
MLQRFENRSIAPAGKHRGPLTAPSSCRWCADRRRRAQGSVRDADTAEVKHHFAGMLWTTLLLMAADRAMPEDLRNLTGLPAYPHLNSAVMDGVYRTDTLGHWCMRFWASASDSLPTVEAWYRKSMTGASEIDLAKDTTYKKYIGLVGIKLAIGIDYVVVYQAAGQAPTSIDLYRCSPIR